MTIQGAKGQLVVSAKYITADLLTTETVTRTYELDGSSVPGGTTGVYPGAEPENDGGSWGVARELNVPWQDLAPADVDTSDAAARQWTRWAFVEVTVSKQFHARVVSGTVYTVPAFAVFESADTDYPVHVAGGGTPAESPAHRIYPVEQADDETPDDDPRLGTRWALDVNAALHRMGPKILNAHAWDESAAVPGATDNDWTTTSTTFVDMDVSGRTTYDPTGIGYSISSAGYARRLGLSDPELGLPNRAAVPVRLWVLGSVTSGQTGTIRVYSSAESWVDVSITSTTIAWHSGVGILECGQSADDSTNVQIQARTTGGTLTVRARSLAYEEHGAV